MPVSVGEALTILQSFQFLVSAVELKAEAARVVKSRMMEDSFAAMLSGIAKDVKNIHTATLLQDVLNIGAAAATRDHMHRIAQAMNALGWSGPQAVRVKGIVAKGYHRAVYVEPVQEELPS